MAESAGYEKILFIHSADGEEWSKYLKKVLLKDYKIASDKTQYKNICETHFNNYLIKVLIFTPLMEEEDKVSATLKKDTLSLYVLLHCSVDIEEFISQNKTMNIVCKREINQSGKTVRKVLENIIELHESYFDHYDEIDENKISFHFFPEEFYPGQNRLFIAFNELKNTTYSVKVSGCKENIPTFQCAENILSCLLPQCEAGRKSVQLYDEKGSKEPLLTSSILIVTAESLVLDIFEYYKSCKSPGINYRAFTESKNIFKDLHGIYQETLSNLLRDTLNVSTTEDERPPLPERKHRIQLRPTANQISYSRRRAEIGQYVDYRGVPQIRIRNQRSNHQKLINRQKISSYLDNIVPPILPKRINERP